LRVATAEVEPAEVFFTSVGGGSVVSRAWYEHAAALAQKKPAALQPVFIELMRKR
jgi:hypothetical protein